MTKLIKLLLEKFPNKNWDFNFIQANLDIKYIEENNFNWDFKSLLDVHKPSLTFIEKNIDKDWNFDKLSFIVSFDFIEKYIDKNWNWNILSIRNDIKFDFIDKYIDKLNLEKLLLLDFDFNHLEKHLHRFNGDELSKKKNLTLEIIDKFQNIKWNWSIITSVFPYNIMIENPERPWDFKNICKRVKIPFEILKIFKDRLNWDEISTFRQTKVEEIEETINILPWNFEKLSHNMELYIDRQKIKENNKFPFEHLLEKRLKI